MRCLPSFFASIKNASHSLAAIYSSPLSTVLPCPIFSLSFWRNMFFVWSHPEHTRTPNILNQPNSSTFSSNTGHLSILKADPGLGLPLIFHTPHEQKLKCEVFFTILFRLGGFLRLETQIWLQNAIICSGLGSRNPHNRGHLYFRAAIVLYDI